MIAVRQFQENPTSHVDKRMGYTTFKRGYAKGIVSRQQVRVNVQGHIISVQDLSTSSQSPLHWKEDETSLTVMKNTKEKYINFRL